MLPTPSLVASFWPPSIYQQQLLGGFKGFYHLSKIASALNLSIVEPFVFGTSLTGVPSLSENARVQSLKLSHFYDLYGLRDAFHQCSNIKLETFEAFLLLLLPQLLDSTIQYIWPAATFSIIFLLTQCDYLHHKHCIRFITTYSINNGMLINIYLVSQPAAGARKTPVLISRVCPDHLLMRFQLTHNA